jgi:hypothetical protein
MLKLLARPPNKTVLVAWSKKSTDFADEIFKISVVSCIIVSKFSCILSMSCRDETYAVLLLSIYCL